MRPKPHTSAPDTGSANEKRLHPRHVDYCVSRAIPPELAIQRGFSSAPTKVISERLGFSQMPAGLAMLIEYPEIVPPYYRARLNDGRWLATKGRSVPIYWACRPEDVGKVLYVAEGPAKALAVTAAGYPAIGLGGVNTTLVKGRRGPEFNESWPSVAGLRVIILFDANRRTNVQVAAAEVRLAQALEGAGAAEVCSVEIPFGPDGEDWGPDDYLAARGVDALAKLVTNAVATNPIRRLDGVLAVPDQRERRLTLDALTADLPFLLSVTGHDYARRARAKRAFAGHGLAGAFRQALVTAERRLAIANKRLLQAETDRRVAQRMPQGAVSPSTATSFDMIGDEGVARLAAHIEEQRAVALSLVTSGPDPLLHQPRLLQVALGAGELFLVNPSELANVEPLFRALRRVPVVAYDGKPLLKWLRHHYGTSPASVFCIRTAAILLAGGNLTPKKDRRRVPNKNPRDRFSLPHLLHRFLGIDVTFRPMPDSGRWSPPRLAEAARRVRYLLPLARRLRDELEADNLTHVALDLEMPLIPVLADVELAGFGFDRKELVLLGRRLRRQPRTQSVDAFLNNQYRNLLAASKKYADGRVRAEFIGIGASTGRVTVRNPALQAIPKLVAGHGARACFVPADGRVLVVADVSQVEVRILAELSQCVELVAALRDGHDVHRSTAAHMLGRPVTTIASDEREKAKVASFGIVYGITAAGLSAAAQDFFGLDMSVDEAAMAINLYLDSFPGVRAWQDAIKESRPRIMTTKSGRIRYFRQTGRDTNKMLNFPVQGLCADGLKRTMLLVHRSLDPASARIVNTVHDELVVEADRSVAGEVARCVRRSFETGFGHYVRSVPITVHIDIRATWDLPTKPDHTTNLES